MDPTPDFESLTALDLIPTELLWHALASRYDAAVFAGVRDVSADAEHVDCAALGSHVVQRGLLPVLEEYVITHAHTAQTPDDDDEQWSMEN